jgi:hypothetical protein
MPNNCIVQLTVTSELVTFPVIPRSELPWKLPKQSPAMFPLIVSKWI